MLSVALTLLVAVAIFGSLAVVSRLDDTDRRWRDIARARFVLGVPWGTLVVIAIVLTVYLFVQDGISNLSDPVTIPYRAWSYFYPLGILTSSFSHASFGHLVGNLIATVAVAPIAEYVWGHYPDEEIAETLPWWRSNPWVRALVLFPLAVIGIGIVTSLFALGPVIGFSGLVFAFAGFAIVRYPITTLIATIGIQSALVTVYNSLRSPVFVYAAEASPPSAPSWANVAIQGHALGFFIGLVLGIALLERRRNRTGGSGVAPSAMRIWIAVLLYAFSKGLWQIYWFGEGNTYYLFRGPGVALVAALALVITLAIAASNRPVLPDRFATRIQRARSSRDGAPGSPVDRPIDRLDGEESAHSEAGVRFERIRELASSFDAGSRGAGTLTRRGTAFVSVLLVLAVLGGVAIPLNLLVIEGATDADGPTVQIEDYTVQYAEGVENELVSGIGIDAIEDDAGLSGDGVIVSSDRRNLWMEAITAARLEFSGSETVSVGGPGWRETVHVERAGWDPVGNDTVYQVWLWQDGTDRQLAYESNASRADVRIDNSTVAIAPDEGEFLLEIDSDGDESVSSVPVPELNESAVAGGLTVENEDGTLYAETAGTTVAVAHEESYDG
ncbi:rhomboid family intramembrane serine protease [Natrarchaeobius halalkaliphilus]|uniref:Rhomboid family intramembrane serine protease n=1 Tax=Natrarchaeobius halalkaliphilus TaxID=1679091 RepID=A0A3N6M8M1_9EURY|nr:rhomboid family intramembrane serine protease [Natrarchaeobius halalkaliphilus]RQG89816.1 rhomboid family intramembrane serine protease [Natrarchaeobius halalkaliphilus]